LRYAAVSTTFHLDKSVETPCPVLTFYSYKGGVGRTTLLACFALQLAKKGKKVIIIDCDFEAPGFTNYFGYRFGNEEHSKGGLIEYILDKQFLLSKDEEYIKENLINKIESQYSYQVGNEYTDGEIRVIKAGSYEQKNLANYLEGLARLDIGNVEIFKDFLFDLQTAFKLTYENAVVLIDSRTGFNDTFATLYAISQIVVGVFGTNTQSQTGLKYILDNFLKIQKDKDGNTLPLPKQNIFVQSFSSQEKENGLYKIAKEHFEENPDVFLSDNGENPHESRFFSFSKNEYLAKIGEESNSQEYEQEIHEFMRDFLLAQSKSNQKLFHMVFDMLDLEVAKWKTNPKNFEKNELNQQNSEKTIPKEISNIPKTPIKTENVVIKNPLIELHRKVLENIKIPNAHAEEIKTSDKKKDFYFRKATENFFNYDKFIISGSKGTGKTFIYEVMESESIQQDFCAEYNQEWENYFFINILPIHKDGSKHFRTDHFTEGDKLGINNFFERFWLIYVANQVFSNQRLTNFLNNDFDLSWKFEISNDSERNFAACIRDNEKYALIQTQLKKLNHFLSKANKKLIILFDQLDHVVEPTKWREGIVPLVRYWRSNPYSAILPKIFLRTDLMRSQLTAVNSTELLKRSISIEWTKEETFAYFFQMQLFHNPDFLEFLEQKGTEENYITQLTDCKENYTQVNVDLDMLEYLVEIFFGYSAHKHDTFDLSFGESYDWFEYNLKDGNNEVSLRPFIWLMEKAKEFAINKYEYSENYLIGAKHFADFKALEYAGSKYYNELATEEKGNDILDKFREFLRSVSDVSMKERKGRYKLSEFDNLLQKFINRYSNSIPEIQNEPNPVEYVRNFLRDNGIIRERRIDGGKFINYEVPFLYKYYLLFPNA